MRQLRIQYPGGLYHITARGNERRNIFLNDQDRLLFLKILKTTIKTNNLICHAYCLMNNHYHLLLETPDGNLAHAMRDLNGNFTQRFNKLHDRVGHLLQGRYNSFLIQKEIYLLEVARYIVLNPVRAHIVSSPRMYKWSSYRDTAGIRNPPEWLTVQWVLKFFKKKKMSACKLYARFIYEGVHAKSPFKNIKEGIILGSPQFISWICENTNSFEEEKEFPRSERIIGRPTLHEIFRDIQTKKERNEAISLARHCCGYLSSEIARHLSMDRSTVGKISKKF